MVGMWQVEADDPRFGGVSGLAADRGRLIAITDSGTILRLDLPGRAPANVTLHDLPAVAGRPDRKVGRDAEAIVRDYTGEGWWVAFEQRHSLLYYDAGFTRLIERRGVAGDLPSNRGIEALYFDRAGHLVGLPEATGASDAARLPDGRLALLERIVGLSGLRSRVIASNVDIALPLGAFENPEAITAERLASGATRLWIMTDNDFRSSNPTLLIAIDLAPGR
ncbi:MAG: esterase-like activity of phytase family protein [Sphingomonas sp.]|uniref:esterase-like activity of phytase family protein n=1 Tax=Sphingomonas sp. TaxID=28214 RepID=UPI0017901FCA|nr:esterase-like activity of phytase family protein [Sphingomonas sp.]MBA3667130.1 esterase-like activity of phytase family protein [Sphingomonas sp.]